MQSSTGQYSTQAGEPAQPVQHSVITANSFGFFFRGVNSPLDLGSNLNSSGTIPAGFKESASAAMAEIIPQWTQFSSTRSWMDWVEKASSRRSALLQPVEGSCGQHLKLAITNRFHFGLLRRFFPTFPVKGLFVSDILGVQPLIFLTQSRLGEGRKERHSWQEKALTKSFLSEI
jgi:hypothetical protein